jgi:hypothetical protein
MYIKLFQVFQPSELPDKRLPAELPTKHPGTRLRWHRFASSNLFGVFIHTQSPRYNEVMDQIDFRFCHSHRFSYRGFYKILEQAVLAGWHVRDVEFQDTLDEAARRTIRSLLRCTEHLQHSEQRRLLLTQIGLCIRAFERDRTARLLKICLSNGRTHVHVYRNGLMYINRKEGLADADQLLAAVLQS